MEIKSTKLWAAHWKALPMKTPPNNKADVNYGVDFCNLTSRIMVRFDIPRRLCETFAIDTMDNDEIMEGKLWRHCSSFEASQQRRLKIELCICDSSWCRREMARIWPQISYSIHQGFFSSRILKSSQHFFQTASLGGGKLDHNNSVHPNQISYRIIRGGWISMWNLMAAVRTRRETRLA